MEQEETAMLKPDKSENKPRNSSESSPVFNCLYMTLIMLSLTLSVAALWIPWDRINQLNDQMITLRENYHHMELLVNLSRSSFIDDDNTTNLAEKKENLNDLVMKFDKNISDSEDNLKTLVFRLITALTKRIHENEVDFDKLTRNISSFEASLVDAETRLSEQDKLDSEARNQTRQLIKQVQVLNEKLNEVETETRRKEEEALDLQNKIHEISNNFNEARLSTKQLQLNTDSLEENILAKVNLMMLNATEEGQKLTSTLQNKIESLLKTKEVQLNETIENLNIEVSNQMKQCEEQFKESSSKDLEAEVDQKLAVVTEKIDMISSSVTNATTISNLGKTVENLSGRVNDFSDKINQIVQNFMIVKSLSKMVAGEGGFESRLSNLEKQVG